MIPLSLTWINWVLACWRRSQISRWCLVGVMPLRSWVDNHELSAHFTSVGHNILLEGKSIKHMPILVTWIAWYNTILKKWSAWKLIKELKPHQSYQIRGHDGWKLCDGIIAQLDRLQFNPLHGHGPGFSRGLPAVEDVQLALFSIHGPDIVDVWFRSGTAFASAAWGGWGPLFWFWQISSIFTDGSHQDGEHGIIWRRAAGKELNPLLPIVAFWLHSWIININDGEKKKGARCGMWTSEQCIITQSLATLPSK